MVAAVSAFIYMEEDWANKEVACAAEWPLLGVRYGSVGVYPTILEF
jgi:hypothetical protein